ncbi:MAG: hydrogenase maturation protease, partial [candidate division WOR-3 bacterium]
MKKLLLGIGNELCGNDALGIIIAKRLEKDFPGYDLKTGAFTGIDFLEAIEGYDEVVVIDSIFQQDSPVGSVIELKIEEFAGLRGFSYVHSLNLGSAIELGTQLQLTLPEKIRIFGIVIDRKGDIGETLSPLINERLDNIILALKS